MLTLTSPVNTPYHRIPVGYKMLALLGLTLVSFQTRVWWVQASFAAVVLGLYVLPWRWVFLKAGMRQILRLWPFVVALVLWHFWTQTLQTGSVVVLRMVALVALANLVTMTTPITGIMLWLKRVLQPLQKVGLPVSSFTVAVALFLRFLPSLLERVAILKKSWRSRSQKSSRFRMVVPVTLWVLDDAEQVARALRARGGVNR